MKRKRILRAIDCIALAISVAVGGESARAEDFPAGGLAPGPATPLHGDASSSPQFPPSPPNNAVSPYANLPIGTSLGQAYRPEGYPGPTVAGSLQPEVVRAAVSERFVESTWYTRVDYFHWNERMDGADLVNEDGTLLTLGYVRRIGVERFRAELFGGAMNYDGYGQFDDGTIEPLKSDTNYLGLRGEYDLLLEPDCWPTVSFFVGIGTRFWIRDLPDGMTTLGNDVWGYQETWWTIYPYIGMEKRRTFDNGCEFYASGRIGCTAVTYQFASFTDSAALYPRPDLMGQLECGIRSRHLFLSANFETLAWGESPVVRDTLQPYSRMFTVGLKTGLSF